MTFSNSPPDLNPEQVREMSAYASMFVDRPAGAGTTTDRNAANVMALASSWLARGEALAAAQQKLDRAVYIAEHLFQMVPQQVWRDSGAYAEGVYEGDYRAEMLRDELASLSNTKPTHPEGCDCLICDPTPPELLSNSTREPT